MTRNEQLDRTIPGAPETAPEDKFADREPPRTRPLFLRHGRDIAVLHCGILIISYLLVARYYPSLISEAPGYAYLNESFLIFLIISPALSIALLFRKSSYGVLIILMFRFYLIAVQGYALGGFLSIKLILGIGLIIETAILPNRPYNAVFSGLFVTALIFTQIYNPLFGEHGYVENEIYASSDILISMAFVLGASAAVLNLMVLKCDQREELWKNFELQMESSRTLARFNADLQSYARNIDIESSKRVRYRISRELHDIAGYIFTNLTALLDAACSIPQNDRSSLSDILITARKQARDGLKETRVALRKTREVRLLHEEGMRAVKKITAIFEKVTGVRVSIFWGNVPRSFSRELNIALYRTVQEALTNAVRHGMATEITIHFLVSQSGLNPVLRMIIDDNGMGAENVVKGIGLSGMEERIGSLGGRVGVTNAPNGGFSLTVEVPLGEGALPPSDSSTPPPP